MEAKGKTITLTTITAIVALVVANGAKLLEVAEGTWLFLVKLSDTAPLGLASFGLALSLGILSRPPLQKYLPPCPKHPTRREAAIDLSAAVIGAVVMFAQLRTLNGALLGILAGLLAPQLAKVIAVLWGIRRNP